MERESLSESQKEKIDKYNKQICSLEKTQCLILFIALVVLFLGIYIFNNTDGTKQTLLVLGFGIHNILLANAAVTIIKQKINLKKMIRKVSIDEKKENDN